MMRIFQGLSEVAGQAYYSVKGLKKFNGVKVDHVVWEPSTFRYKSDISLNINKKKKYLVPIYLLKLLFSELKFLKRNDIFHFHFGRSILLNYDLFLYRFLKKKLFFEFHGSDLRDEAYSCRRNPYMINRTSAGNAEKIKKRTVKICKYADGVILHDDELIAHLPNGYSGVFVVPLRMDINSISPCFLEKKSGDRIKVVHAPSNREVKGSKYLIDAIEKLKQEYPVELVLVENKTNEEAIKLYQTADIIVDQLRIGTYGVFAIEGMAMGKPVVTYITDEMKECLPEELPIVSANPDTIYEVLEKLIQDEQLRIQLGRQGRCYVEKYHDYRKNAQVLYDIYSGKAAPMHGREAFSYAAEKDAVNM